MNTGYLSAVLLMLVALGGCTTWPEFGQGGMAEHHLQSLHEDAARTGDSNAPSMAMEHDILARHLDVLVLEGAELCFPATVEQARQRQDRKKPDSRYTAAPAGGTTGHSS